MVQNYSGKMTIPISGHHIIMLYRIINYIVNINYQYRTTTYCFTNGGFGFTNGENYIEKGDSESCPLFI